MRFDSLWEEYCFDKYDFAGDNTQDIAPAICIELGLRAHFAKRHGIVVSSWEGVACSIGIDTVFTERSDDAI